MKNEFFNPDDFPFEVHGFFEELLEPGTGKVIGSREIPEPTRPLGSQGRIEFDITETLTLTKGLKTVTLKASPKKPKRVVGMIQAICGRVKKKGL